MISKIFEMPYISEVSVNSCYGQAQTKNGRPRRYLKKHAKKWKLVLGLLVKKWIRDEAISVKSGLQIIILFDAKFPKPTNGRYPDQNNFHKIPVDAIAEAFGIQDHSIRIRDRHVSHDNETGKLIYEVQVYGEDQISDIA